MFLIGITCRASRFLLAAAACAALTQSVYAGNPIAASDKYTNTGSVAKTYQDTTKSKVLLKSKSKSDIQTIDYTNICIFCHIPNMANHSNAAPMLNNTIKFSPKTIQKTNSSLYPLRLDN
jgi:hypothetical protein